jgi:endoglucanase
MEAAVAQVKEWSEYYGRPVYLGEFGAFTTADPGSRAHYYSSGKCRLRTVFTIQMASGA